MCGYYETSSYYPIRNEDKPACEVRTVIFFSCLLCFNVHNTPLLIFAIIAKAQLNGYKYIALPIVEEVMFLLHI